MGSSVVRLKAAAALLLAILIAEIALAIWLPLRDKSELDQAPRSDRTYHSVYSGTFKNAAVAADSAICSSLGSYILILGFCSLLESVVGTWLYPMLSNKSNIVITQKHPSKSNAVGTQSMQRLQQPYAVAYKTCKAVGLAEDHLC